MQARTSTAKPAMRPTAGAILDVPRDADGVTLTIDGKAVRLTNLRKPFWRALGVTKGDLLRYYAGATAA